MLKSSAGFSSELLIVVMGMFGILIWNATWPCRLGPTLGVVCGAGRDSLVSELVLSRL